MGGVGSVRYCSVEMMELGWEGGRVYKVDWGLVLVP